MTTVYVRAYGEYFAIECKTDQEIIDVKRILQRAWLDYKDYPPHQRQVPEISAKDWIESGTGE